MKIKLE